MLTKEQNTEKMRLYRAKVRLRGTTVEERATANRRQKEWNAKWRAVVLAAMGSVCKKCGFADARALQIDHVNGDGYKEQPKTLRQGRFYKKVLEELPTGRFQLLCANCNWIKRFENQEHRRPKQEVLS